MSSYTSIDLVRMGDEIKSMVNQRVDVSYLYENMLPIHESINDTTVEHWFGHPIAKQG